MIAPARNMRHPAEEGDLWVGRSLTAACARITLRLTESKEYVMAAATLTSKGQLTLPKEVRTALGVGPGDRVDFVQMEDGNFAILPATHSVKSLKGIIARPKTSVSLADMDKAVARGAKGE